MTRMPYSTEINDIPALLDLQQSPREFGQMICDQFDMLYEDGAKTGRVMSICLHPFLVGYPHRANILPRRSRTSRRAERCGSRPAARSSTGTRKTIPANPERADRRGRNERDRASHH